MRYIGKPKNITIKKIKKYDMRYIGKPKNITIKKIKNMICDI
jgi:hypothetical protein